MRLNNDKAFSVC